MNEIIPFRFEDTSVRVLDIDGEPWFVLADVTSILEHSNSRMVAQRLDDDVRTTYPIQDSMGREQQTYIISESGLYEVIATSRSVLAKPFKKWVFGEVLPQIRKTGSYGVRQLSGPALYLAAIEQATSEIAALEQRNSELEPKAARFDDWLGAKGDYTFTQAAKVLQRDHSINLGARRLIEQLIEWGWVYRVNRPRSAKTGPVSPYQAQLDTGRFTVRATTYVDQYTGDVRAAEPQTRVTPKGVADIAARLTTRLEAAA